MTNTTGALPPLPEPSERGDQMHDFPPSLYTADQMFAYAQEAVRAALANQPISEGKPDARDAARYRWLRECSPIRSDRGAVGVHWPLYENGKLMNDYRYLVAADLDKAIDASMEKDTTT